MPPLKQKNVSDMCHSKIPGQGVVLNKQVYFLQLSMIYCSTNVQSVSQGKILFHQPLVKYPPGPFKSTLKTPLPTTSQKWKTVLSSNCYFSLNYPSTANHFKQKYQSSFYFVAIVLQSTLNMHKYSKFMYIDFHNFCKHLRDLIDFLCN